MERMRRGFAAAVAVGLALLLGGPGPADAQSTLEVVKKRGKLIAGVKTDFPPFGTIDASRRNVGFDVDVAHRFAQALLICFPLTRLAQRAEARLARPS